MSIKSIIKNAPTDMLEDYAKQKRPTKWTCARCGRDNDPTSLRCEKLCGIGLRSEAVSSPEIWDLATAELARRKKN